jgi:ArsR family transcriptional regulator, arsenate/arsenite/antimonite-responsive transcriptional repressor
MDELQLMKVAKALADPTRLNIFRTIATADEISCGEITNRFPIAQATVSHHLKILTESGLINVQRKGQYSYFHAIRDTLEHYRSELGKIFEEAGQNVTN